MEFLPVKLEHILARVQALPVLPSLAMRVVNLTNNLDTDLKELLSVVGQDPALATSILRQANSSFYGYARRISSLPEAVVILGFQTIQNLALASAVSPLLKTNLAGYQVDQEGLWKHSLLTAMIARRLSKRLRLPLGETAFTAGLLHDVGKLVLAVYIQEVGEHILKKVEQDSLSYVEMEERVIGYDHAMVGGLVVKHWNLPKNLVEAITYHHKPELAQSEPILTALVHLANGLANTLGMGGGVDSFLNPVKEEILTLLNIAETDIDRVLAELGDLIGDPSLFN
ncbi:MAG: HDOD domain-containing protein [Desulfitobacteriaceae bacterium]